jgi:hypothetical protein
MKTCPQCSQSKPLVDFLLKNGTHHSWCQPCRQRYARELAHSPEQQAKRRAWYEAHREKVLARAKDRWVANKDAYEPARQKWAADHREEMLDYFQEKSRAFREWVDSLKAGKPCLDCSATFPPYVMEYDHVRGVKLCSIGKMTNYRHERVLEEIAKCDLVCCACHRIRSHVRRGHPATPRLVAFRNWLDSLKTNPCTDCGRTLHPVAMDFDHVRGDKTWGVSNIYTWGRGKVLEEIAKCELVCANCHRERTVRQLRSGPTPTR